MQASLASLKDVSQMRRAIPQIRLALDLVRRSAPGWTLASAILILIQGALPLASLYLMKRIVDSLDPSSPTHAGIRGFSDVLMLVLLAGSLALIAAAVRLATSVVSTAQSALITDYVQDILHAKSVEVDLEYYDNAAFYDSLHRAQNEAPSRPTQIVNSLLSTAQNGLSLLGVAALLAAFSPLLTAVLVLATIPSALVKLSFAGKTFEWQKRVTARDRSAWYFHWLLTSNIHAKEIRLFGLGPLFIDKYRSLKMGLRDERLALTIRRSESDAGSQLFSVLATFGCLSYIALKTWQGEITLGSLVMYFGAFQQGQSFLTNLITSLLSLYEDSLFLTTVREFMDLEPKVKDPPHPQKMPEVIERLTFRDVSFKYPGLDRGLSRQSLQGINLDITRGKMIALVGENGSGKTTLIKLLSRLYDPDSGHILLNGIDLRDLRVRDLRREISILLQDYGKYNMTFKENIQIGSAEVTDPQEIDRAARSAGADEVIKDLPQGYDTMLGSMFEGSKEVSPGQWQRIALARSFFRPCQIMVIDEPTSALDPNAEAKVLREFKERARDKLAIVISHRLSAAREADRIYYLRDGCIIEAGTHEELVNAGGEYARLFQLQAEGYR